MKVELFDRKLRDEYDMFISKISTIISFVLIFVSIPDNYKIKLICATVFVIFLVLSYIIKWRKSNQLQSISLKINKTNVNIRAGDIFETDGLKVISFNEYFDTIVDDVIIARGSLNGIFINEHIDSISELDESIASDEILKKNIICTDTSRSPGKQIKYRLGSIHKFNDYLLLAFTRFNSVNEATLTKKDYIQCLVNMWDEIDRTYAGYSVNIPLLGSGMAIRNFDCTEQELLEALIISLKLSRLRINDNISINIIIKEDKLKNTNLYKFLKFSD